MSLKVRLQTFRLKLQRDSERLYYLGVEKLEKIPPLKNILLKVPTLRFQAWALGAFLCTDLLIQAGVALFLSKPSKPKVARVVQDSPYLKNRSQYESLITRNIFCPGCPVPDMKMRAIDRPKDCGRASPFAQTPSLKIIGTIVLSDPKYSVATVSTGSAETVALKKGDDFMEYGKVFEIRRSRICFVDSNGLLHAVDMPDDSPGIRYGQPLATSMPVSNYDGIERASDTNFVIKRSFLMEKINDPALLFQAAAVPYKENGQLKGFKILKIDPGSVYEALGIQVGDIVSGVNGEPMNSVSRAQELYAAANSAKEVNLEVIRNGSPVLLNYKVK